jgi:hypothetical protein
MALTTTSLAVACGASDTMLAITSTSSGFPAVGTVAENQLMTIDGESMFVTGVPSAGYVIVRGRGSDGTAAVAHDILAPVNTSSNVADFPAVAVGATTLRPLQTDDMVTVGQNGAIAVPLKNTTVLLTKGSALSSTTLAAPSKAQNGLKLTITSQTAYAHVITATTLLADAVSGSPHTTATYAAYIGASITLVADNGLWNIVAAVGVTVT